MIDMMLDLAKENMASFGEAILDQVAVGILANNFVSLNEDCEEYLKVAINIINLPEDENMHKDLKDFITRHNLNVKEIKEALKDARSRLQRLQSNEKQLGDAISNLTHVTHRDKPGSSMMKMPRITLPSFHGGEDGTISWEVFRNMVNRISETMHTSENIYFLKANLSEEPKRLISLEEEF